MVTNVQNMYKINLQSAASQTGNAECENIRKNANFVVVRNSCNVI